jgi:L-seryl-tRNA(Ser) seleniumtransferase
MHRFLDEPNIAAYAALLGTSVVKATVDDVLRDARGHLRADVSGPTDFDELAARVRALLSAHENDGLVDVLNATGVLLHTNLGRSPLAAEALAAAARISGGYSNLEFDLAAGKRGTRYERVTPLLCELSGARDALVVNNCAAAVLLILDTFAKDREVIVSRDQLIEIGGGFRLPEVLSRSGATLVEVGTTNKVYLRDFERALGVRTALLLRSHTSNYRIEGFTAGVAARDLAALGKRVGVTTVEDLGGGALIDLAPYGLPNERTVPQAVADGIDLVAFSGDKLLGGPQAGIVVGGSAAIARLRANPLLRALRVDKATLAALGATLQLYLRPGGVARIPFFAMLAATPGDLERRARPLAAALGTAAAVCETQAYAGGGAAPLQALPSWGITLRSEDLRAGELAARLRRAHPHVLGRVAQDAVVIDLRTVAPERDPELRAAIAAAFA